MGHHCLPSRPPLLGSRLVIWASPAHLHSADTQGGPLASGAPGKAAECVPRFRPQQNADRCPCGGLLCLSGRGRLIRGLQEAGPAPKSVSVEGPGTSRCEAPRISQVYAPDLIHKQREGVAAVGGSFPVRRNEVDLPGGGRRGSPRRGGGPVSSRTQRRLTLSMFQPGLPCAWLTPALPGSRLVRGSAHS